MWQPIRGEHPDIVARMRAGRLASQVHANKVMSKLLEADGHELPAELVERTASWLRILDQETCGDDKDGLIKELAADFELKCDVTGIALSSLKGLIDRRAANFEMADALRHELPSQPITWAAGLFYVSEALNGTVAQMSRALPPQFGRAINILIANFRSEVIAMDWQGCCDSMAALDRFISDQLVASPRELLPSYRVLPAMRRPDEVKGEAMSLRSFIDTNSGPRWQPIHLEGADTVSRAPSSSLRMLKTLIDSSEGYFKDADVARQDHRKGSDAWSARLAIAADCLTGLYAGMKIDLPEQLRGVIERLLNDFKLDVGGQDWQACCETMAALDRVVSGNFIPSSGTSLPTKGLRRSSQVPSQTEQTLVSLRTVVVERLSKFEMEYMNPENSVDSACAKAVRKLAGSLSNSLPPTIGKSISDRIKGMQSTGDKGLYFQNFIALRQSLSAWIHDERSKRRI